MLKKSIFLLLFATSLYSMPFKVYDCFIFFDEIELLNIRLKELHRVVDHFVIVEADRTFDGKPKPLNFLKHKDKFKDYEKKIVYIPLTNLNSDIEINQRNAILQGLKNAEEKDLIFISDVDEILSIKKICELSSPLFHKNKKIVRGSLRNYRYFINRRDTEHPYDNAFVATKLSYLKEHTPYEIRYSQNDTDCIIPDAGWHFSCIGFVSSAIDKLKAFNQEISSRYYKNAKMILRKAKDCLLTNVDNSYPQYVVDHLNYYEKHNFLDHDIRRSKALKLMVLRERENKTINHHHDQLID